MTVNCNAIVYMRLHTRLRSKHRTPRHLLTARYDAQWRYLHLEIESRSSPLRKLEAEIGT